jgi:intracellular septation protein A
MYFFFILTTEEINILAFYFTTPCSVWSDYRHFGRTPVFFFTVEVEAVIFYKKSLTTQTARFHNAKHHSLQE